MRKWMLFIVAVNLLISCSSHPGSIVAGDVAFVSIESNKKINGISHFNLRLKEENVVNPICNAINNAKEYPAKFIAQYYLTIHYKNGQETLVLFNGDHLKINGLTYKMNSSFYNVLDEALPKDIKMTINF